MLFFLLPVPFPWFTSAVVYIVLEVDGVVRFDMEIVVNVSFFGVVLG